MQVNGSKSSRNFIQSGLNKIKPAVMYSAACVPVVPLAKHTVQNTKSEISASLTVGTVVAAVSRRCTADWGG